MVAGPRLVAITRTLHWQQARPRARAPHAPPGPGEALRAEGDRFGRPSPTPTPSDPPWGLGVLATTGLGTSIYVCCRWGVCRHVGFDLPRNKTPSISRASRVPQLFRTCIAFVPEFSHIQGPRGYQGMTQ